MITGIQTNKVAGRSYLSLALLLLFASQITMAQSSAAPKVYKGFELSFGTRSFNITSDIPQINNDAIAQAGGQLGLIFGNETLRSRIGLLGYCSSYNNILGTVDLFETNLSVNFYPLSLILNKPTSVAPYLSTGVAFDKIRFYGHYLTDDAGQVNYSTAEAPYLGSINQFNASIGAGLTWALIEHYDFVHLFSEIRYGYNFSGSTARDQFENTTTENAFNMNFGIRFGAIR